MISNVVTPQNVYALVVGIEKYDDPTKWPDLDGSANAALEFTKWLYDQEVPSANINLCLSLLDTERDLKLPEGIAREQATFSQVFEILNKLARTKGEMFFLFWAGHGVIANKDRRLFFADATERNPLNLNLDRELDALGTDSYLGFPQQFCFVDACATPIEKIAMSTTIPNNDIIAKGLENKTVWEQYASFAAKEGENARNGIIRKIGYFSEVLMKELKGRTLSLDLEELSIALKKRFEQLHRTNSKFTQTPNYYWIKRNADQKELDYRYRASTSLLSQPDRQNRDRVLKRMRKIWIGGLLTQSYANGRIDLRLQDRPDMLENPWQRERQELKQFPQTLPDGTTIVQVFDDAKGELLILGEPGSGKTTLLLELIQTLLEQAEENEQLRIPVVFDLSSWAEKRQPFRAWLVEELSSPKYRVPRKIAQGWIDTDQVLPLLDGLDEVAKDARDACVEQINTYHQSQLERGNRSLVVCCRNEEYTALSTPIEIQNAVSILPLTDEQMDIYLEQAGVQVDTLRQALNKDAELHSLACQPLMLNIFILAYQEAGEAEIPTGKTREEARDITFAKYTEHMLNRGVKSKRWKPEQILRHLTFLAKQMQERHQTIFSVESLQPTWLSRTQVLPYHSPYQWCARLTIWLIFGLLFGLRDALITGLVNGLTSLLFWAPIVGMVPWLLTGRATKIDPAEEIVWSWKKARFSGLLGVPIAGVMGIVCARLSGLTFGVTIGLLNGLICWSFFGLSMGLVSERHSLTPNAGIWRSGRNGLTIALVLGLSFGPLGGLFGGLVGGLATGLVGALVFGLMMGLNFGLAAFIYHFILRFFLSRQGDLPWDLVLFLDEATGRLLLRKVGGSYKFVHLLLRDHLALQEVLASESVVSSEPATE